MRRRAAELAVAAVAALALVAPAVSNSGTTSQPGFPIRAAFFYPWFPRNWTQFGRYPFSHYVPTLGYYDTTNPAVVQEQMAALRYAHVEAGLYSWWGRGSEEDRRFSIFLSAAGQTPFRWAVYYEPEGYRNPTVAQIRSDLLYLSHRYMTNPAYLRVNGRPVVFVYGGTTDTCARPAAWKAANTIHAYLVLKVFTGYEFCRARPDGWHQYEPADAEYNVAPSAYTISPGFWNATDAVPRLARDVARWRQQIADMKASRVHFQLITSFNEWGEGTSVESGKDWETASGFGAYLDALHDNP